MACFSQCSMPLYVYFFLFFCDCVFVLPMLYDSLIVFLFFFCFFATVVMFCQCSMPLYLYCFILLLCLRTVWPMLYASFLFFFLLCLWLGFSNVLCLFIYIFVFSVCVSDKKSMFSFRLCLWLVLPMFYTSILYFSFLSCPLLGFANVLCLFYLYFLSVFRFRKSLFIFFIFCLCLGSANAL